MMSVAAPAGKAHDQAHRPRRIGIRPHDARDCRQRGGARCQQKISAGKFHGLPPGRDHKVSQLPASVSSRDVRFWPLADTPTRDFRGSFWG